MLVESSSFPGLQTEQPIISLLLFVKAVKHTKLKSLTVIQSVLDIAYPDKHVKQAGILLSHVLQSEKTFEHKVHVLPLLVY